MPNLREVGSDVVEELVAKPLDDFRVTIEEGPWPERIRNGIDKVRWVGNMAVHAVKELPNTLRYRLGGAIMNTIKDTFTYGNGLNHLDNPDKPAFNTGNLEEEIGQGNE